MANPFLVKGFLFRPALHVSVPRTSNWEVGWCGWSSRTASVRLTLHHLPIHNQSTISPARFAGVDSSLRGYPALNIHSDQAVSIAIRPYL